MPNVYCSPFFDPSSECSLDEPLAWLIIGVNFIAVSLNLIFHSKLIAEVMIYQNDYLRAKSRNQFKMSLFIQILYMTCCHLLCWVFGIIVLLISILQRIYPIEIILLQLVIIAPIEFNFDSFFLHYKEKLRHCYQIPINEIFCISILIIRS